MKIGTDKTFWRPGFTAICKLEFFIDHADYFKIVLKNNIYEFLVKFFFQKFRKNNSNSQILIDRVEFNFTSFVEIWGHLD